MYCKKCGNQLPEESKFCNKCGTSIDNTTNPNANINNVTNNINDNKTDKKRGLYIVIIGVVLLVITVVIIFFSGKNKPKGEDNPNPNNTEEKGSGPASSEEETYTFNNFKPDNIEITKESATALNDNIEIKKIFFNPGNKDYGKYRDAHIYGKNNNNEPVRVKIIILLYDSDNYQVDKKYDEEYVRAGSDFVIGLDIPSDSEYDHAKIQYQVSKKKSYETDLDLSSFELTTIRSTNSYSDDIRAYVKSKASQKAYVNIMCLYYKEGNLVFALERNYISLEPDESYDQPFYGHQLNLNSDYKNLKRIEYDDFKVIIYGAYNSNSTSY